MIQTDLTPSPKRRHVSRSASYGTTNLFYQFKKPDGSIIPNMKMARNFYKDLSTGVGDIFDIHFDQLKLTIQFDRDGPHKYVSNGKEMRFSIREDLFERAFHKKFSQEVDRFQNYEFQYLVRTDHTSIMVQVYVRIGVWPQQIAL